MSCQNLLRIMGSKIYGKGRTQIPQFTCSDRSSDTRSRICRVYTDIKIANNRKINHITVSFTDLYNAISIDRLPSKTQIIKDSWCFKKFFNVSPSSPQVQRIGFFIKKKKKMTLQQVTGRNTTNFVLKRLLGHFLKTPPLKKILEFQDWKKDCKIYTKKKLSNQKSSQWLKTFKMNFIN